jgi:hypothetical protein
VISASVQSDEKKQTIKLNIINKDNNEVISIREMMVYYKDLPDNDGVSINPKKMFYG